MDKRFAIIASAVTLLMHLATASQYGYYRDELYFIACAKRLAWGYVDMPPLAPLMAWFSAPAHYELIALRASVALAAGITVYIACAITAEIGGSWKAQVLAALTVALTPVYLFLGNTLTTTSFEPFTWALTIYAAMRLVRTRDARWSVVLSATVTFGFYAKYSIGLLVIALLVGLLLTRERAIFKRAYFPVAALAVAALLAPNIAWQAAHGWPFVAVMHGDIIGRHAFNSGVQYDFRQPLVNAIAFYSEQIIFFNPIATPLWLLGAYALLTNAAFRSFRFVGIGFVFMLLVAAALNAKGYYIAGVYTVLLCTGWVTLERWAGQLALRFCVPLVAICQLVVLPFTLPVLPPHVFLAYSHATGIPQPLFADEFGWDALTRRVADLYSRIPPPQRARTAIFSDTYGGAGALEFYGPRYHLPPPISAQNNYYLWGPRTYDGRSVLAIGASQQILLRANFRRVILLGTFSDPYRASAEGPTPIYLCTDPIAPLPQLWPRFKWYGA